MTEYFVKGGPFMYPILGLLIIGLVIALFKLVSLLMTGKDAGKMMQEIKKKLATGGVVGLLVLAVLMSLVK